MTPAKAAYVTSGQAVVSIGASTPMKKCNHEEADTRVVVHIVHAQEEGADYSSAHRRYRCCSHPCRHIPLSDCDSSFGRHLGCLWHGQKLQVFPHKRHLCKPGGAKSRALPVLNAFSGCDTTSAFNGKGKKSVWQAWHVYEDITETFVYLASHPFQLLDVDDDHFKKIERLTVILYDKTSPLRYINDTRSELFGHKNRAMDKLPPTNDALLQHVRRAVYQAGIWKTSTQIQLLIPSPHDFAWTKISDSWVRVWVTIPEASGADQMFLQRGLLHLPVCKSKS